MHAELVEVDRRLPGGKAPGPDAVPNEMIRFFLREDPDVLLRLYKICWKETAFLKAWKRARLVLLFKREAKLPTEVGNFTPISFLNSSAKLIERLILGRLNEFLSRSGGLSVKKFGFRKGMVTIGTIQ